MQTAPRTEASREATSLEHKRITQSERILGILMDGFWHSGLEFTRLGRPILSYTRRIFELRQMGHIILLERKDGLLKYRLVQ